MRKKTGKLLSCLSIVLVFLLLTAVNGFAVSVPELPAGADYRLTLSLNEKSTGSNGTKEIPISGAELTAIRVADLKVEDGFAVYTPVPAFSGLAVNYDGMTTEQSNEVAAVMAKMINDNPGNYTSENGVATMKDVTDASGKVAFSGNALAPGMYLIRETNRTGKALEYEVIKPYLVSVPEYCAGEWIVKVEAEPKMEPVKVPPTTKKTVTTKTTTKPTTKTTRTTTKKLTVTVPVKIAKYVNTDDGTRIVMWVLILAVSAVAMFIVSRKLRKENRSE